MTGSSAARGSSSTVAGGRSGIGRRGGGVVVRVGGGGSTRVRAGAGAGSRGSEWDGNTEARFISVWHIGSECCERLVTSGGWVDGTEHARRRVRPRLCEYNSEKIAYPLLQCGGRPQKNQTGTVGSVTAIEYTPTTFEAGSKGMKPELNPFFWRAVLNVPRGVTTVRLVI